MTTLGRLVEPKAFKNYYVLLSCAEDTHAGFSGHLFYALRAVEFRTILNWDCQKLERNAFEEFLICIVVLSERYLSSPSHLDKLAEIVVEFTPRKMGQLLLAVFYAVDPSHLRDLIGSYRNSVEPERFETWTQALTRVAALTGFHFQRDGDTYEYQCIEKIVQQVSKHVASTIGLNPEVKEVVQLLSSGSDDGIHVVGICEDPIIGKKTIARRVYDLIAAGEGFDNYCILNVGENLREPGLVHLLDMFYSGMVGNNRGMTLTKSTLSQKKVFIVFEGINYVNLLKVVVELTHWFGSGSRVIITSRDKCLLENNGVKRVYQVARSGRTTVRYENVIDCAETCASVDLLALEVIDYNSPEKSIEECKSALDQCERIPNSDLMTQNMVREKNWIQLSEDILEENKEYGSGMPDAQPASDDRSRNWDPMELEYQLCSSSSSLDDL